MKTLPTDILTARQARAGVIAHALIYITAKDRDTGDPASLGFWTGDDHQAFTINSVDRTYYGAGNLIDMPDIQSEVGIQVRQIDVVLSPLSVEVQQAVLGYNARLAPVEIHRAEFDTVTNNLIAEPLRVFKGWVDRITWASGTKDGDCSATLTCVTVARALTKTLSQKFSDSAQRLVDEDDAFFQYVDVSGETDVWWGEKRSAT